MPALVDVSFCALCKMYKLKANSNFPYEVFRIPIVHEGHLARFQWITRGCFVEHLLTMLALPFPASSSEVSGFTPTSVSPVSL